MSDVSQFVTSRRRLAAMLSLAMLAGVLLLGMRAPAAHAENHCTSGELCVWSGTFYTGTENTLHCYSGTIPLEFPSQLSAKNRCSISQELGWKEGGSINWKFCMRPGGERPEPGRFNVYRVGGC